PIWFMRAARCGCIACASFPTNDRFFGQASMKPRENPVLHLATSNSGKVGDFTAIAQESGVEMRPFPGFAALPPVLEDGSTFEQNARKKAQQYSLALPGEMVIADDSGLEVEALAGAPGVLSARYGAEYSRGDAAQNSSDAANNAHLLRELAAVPDDQR